MKRVYDEKHDGMILVLRFAHPYYKLKSKVFPTTRGKTAIKKYPVDMAVKIIEPAGEFYGVIIDVSLRKISSLSHSFLKLDGNYPNHDIKTHADFVDLLNSFRRFHKIGTIEEEVSIIWVLQSCGECE